MTSTEASRAAYRAGVAAYLDANPPPQVVDEPCTTCLAPAGQPCTTCGPCPARLIDHLERVDLHRVAADTAARRAAQTTSAPAEGTRKEAR